MKNLTKKFLVDNKERAIEIYLDTKVGFKTYTYTKGKKVFIDTLKEKAYSSNGLLYAVILKDDSFLNYASIVYSTEIIDYLDGLYGDDSDVEDEDEE